MHYYRIGGDSFRSVMQETNPICFISSLKIGCRGDSSVLHATNPLVCHTKHPKIGCSGDLFEVLI